MRVCARVCACVKTESAASMIDLHEPSSVPCISTVDQLGIRTATVTVRVCACLLLVSSVPLSGLSGVLRLSRKQCVRVCVAVLFLCVTDFSVCARVCVHSRVLVLCLC